MANNVLIREYFIAACIPYSALYNFVGARQFYDTVRHALLNGPIHMFLQPSRPTMTPAQLYSPACSDKFYSLPRATPIDRTVLNLTHIIWRLATHRWFSQCHRF